MICNHIVLWRKKNEKSTIGIWVNFSVGNYDELYNSYL